MKRGVCRRRDDRLTHRHTRVAAISSLTFDPGNTPPKPGLALGTALMEIALTVGSIDFSRNRSASKCPSGVRQPK